MLGHLIICKTFDKSYENVRPFLRTLKNKNIFLKMKNIKIKLVPKKINFYFKGAYIIVYKK